LLLVFTFFGKTFSLVGGESLFHFFFFFFFFGLEVGGFDKKMEVSLQKSSH
jgi:hypothetical protein